MVEQPDQPIRRLPRSGPLLGIDWGVRKIGLAVSDPTQTVAHPLETLVRRTGRRFPLARLRPLLEEHRPVGIVMGLPLEPNGEEGEAAQHARATAQLLADKTGLPVDFIDERMSTARIRKDMTDTGHRPADHDIDQAAAGLVLQVYLDSWRP